MVAAGVVIPWEIGGELWRVNIRRPVGDPKYIGPAGCAMGLYNADALTAAPAVLVEGEIDALTVGQAAGDLVTAVATGSVSWGHRPRGFRGWLCPLLCWSPLTATPRAKRRRAGGSAC